MQGGSEIIDQRPQEVLLLDGMYNIESERQWYPFWVHQIGDDLVIIRFGEHVELPILRTIQLTLIEYRDLFLPVVDSGANNDHPRRFTIHGTTWPGLWWSRAILEAPPRGREGGKHQRKRSGHKRHKRSSHKRSSHKNKSQRRRRH